MAWIHRVGRVPRILLLCFICGAVALLIGMSVGGTDQPGVRSPFTSLVSAAAHPASALDTIADLIFGQPDFVSAAPNPPTDSSVASPGAVVVDVTTGRIFVADTGNNRVLSWESVDVYEVGEPADLVFGQPDFVSNGANPPSATSLNAPSAITVDYDGTLYVADTGNNRVLAYTPELGDEDYPIYTSSMAADLVIGQPDFASNSVADPPSAASLSAPQGITFDNRGNLVVADRDNHRVLGFEPPFVSTMDATYLLGQPRNADGSLNFSSRAASNPPTATSLNQPVGVAVGVLSDKLYVGDTGNNRVLLYDLATGDEIADLVIGQPNFSSRAVPAQPSAASLNGPTGMTVDSADRLYVADTGNNRVLVYPNPAASTSAAYVFGQSDSFTSANAPALPDAATLSGPTGVAADGIIGIYIADRGNQRVLGYDQPLPNAQPILVPPLPATVRVGSDAFELEVEGVGFITGSQVLINGVARETTFEAEWLLTVPISAAELAAPTTLSVQVVTPAPGGGTSSSVALTVYAPAAGDVAADRVLGKPDFVYTQGEYEPAEATTLFNPGAVAIDRQTGRVFVADSNNSRILSWPDAAQFADGQPADLVIGQPDFTSSDPAEPDYGGPEPDAQNLDMAMGVAVDNSGNLYVADTYNNRVLIYEAPLSNSMAASRVIGQPDFNSDEEPETTTATNLAEPRGIVVGADGTLFVADSAHHRVLAYRNPLTSDAVADRVFGQPDFTFSWPNAAGVNAASLDGPTHVALDADGTLYVADSNNNRVLAFRDPLTGDTAADLVIGQPNFSANQPNNGGISATSLNLPLGLAFDPLGWLYVSDTDNNRVLVYANIANGSTTASRVFGQGGSFTGNAPNLGGPGAASLNLPIDVAFDQRGNLLIADFENSRVLAFDQPAAGTQIYLPLVRR